MTLFRLPAPLVTLAVLLAAPSALPCESRAPQAPQEAGAPLPEARAVIDRFLKITKWDEAIERTRVRHDTGTVSFSGIEGTTESWTSKPARQMLIMDLGGFGQMLSGCDGDVAWMSSQMTGSMLLEGSDLLQARLEAHYSAPTKPESLYESIRTLGKKDFEGKECFELELVAKPLEGMDADKTKRARTSLEYYEVESGLLRGMSGYNESNLAAGPTSRVFHDYKEFGGVQLPVRASLKQGGMEMVMTIESVEFDVADAKAFEPPIEVQKMIEAAKAKGAPKESD